MYYLLKLNSGLKGASIKGESGLDGYDGEKGDKGERGLVKLFKFYFMYDVSMSTFIYSY